MREGERGRQGEKNAIGPYSRVRHIRIHIYTHEHHNLYNSYCTYVVRICTREKRTKRLYDECDAGGRFTLSHVWRKMLMMMMII